MKYSEIAKLKATIMETLEKSVNELLDQVQANEQQQVLDEKERVAEIRRTGKIVFEQPIDLQAGFLEAAIVLDFPEYQGSNGNGFVMFCNPIVSLKDSYKKTDCHNYSHKIMSDKVQKLTEERQARREHFEREQAKIKEGK